MEERAPQNSCSSVYFVTFTSTLVYSVVWNQSLVLFKISLIFALDSVGNILE